MEEKPPGRSPGYHHSEDTKRKIKEAHQGLQQSTETRRKISESMKGREKSAEHRAKLSELSFDREAARDVLYLDNRCLDRLAELKANYPDHEEFFEENETALLMALRDVKSDKEIEDITRYIESEDIDKYAGSLSYQYASSSFYAQEDAVIAVIDTMRYLRKFH